jgi:long-chain acyl-CoA synthetase
MHIRASMMEFQIDGKLSPHHFSRTMTDYPWFAHYDRGVPRTLAPYPERTLLDFAADAMRERPDSPMFLFKGTTITRTQLDRTSDAFAVALAGLGVARGDRVALVLPNCPQFFVAEFALWKIGAIVAPLNPVYTEEEMVGPLNLVEATVVVTLTPFYERVKAIQPRTSVRRVITTNIKEWFPPLLRLAFTAFAERKAGHRVTRRDGDLSMADLIARHDSEHPVGPPAAPDDIAMLLLSGGTTGTPKAVPCPHRGLVITGLQLRAWTKAVMTEWKDVYMLPLPLFHSYAACAVQTTAIVNRNPIALIPNPRDLDDILRGVTKVKPAAFSGVPTLYNALLNHPRVRSGKVNFRSLKACTSGAAPLMAETKKRFEAVTGGRIIEAYSLTEALIAATANPLEGDWKPGSVGIPLPDVIVKIVGADDPTLAMPVKEVGEILIKGLQVMKGYWRDPEETAVTIVTNSAGETWLHSGDLGYLDEDGYLFIVDRKKDLIKVSGLQVWPREIEEAVAAHPAVAEVGVRGFPDEKKGEVAVAFVVLRPGMTATEEEIRTFARQHVTYYKIPGRVIFRRELPKSLVGKVLRRMLTLEEPNAMA